MEKMLFLVILLALAFVPYITSIPFDERDLESDEKVWDLYERWQRHHAVSRDHHEKHKRFGVFKENANFIHEFNKEENSFKLALNKFGDLTNEEFKGSYAGSRIKEHRMFRPRAGMDMFIYGSVNVRGLPESVDWRLKGAVTGVKDQGKCGSCWAFSTVVSVEGINQIKTGGLLSLSEQELIDCDSDDSGCEGGFMENGFAFIKKSGGIITESDYPYKAANGTCNAQKMNSPAVVIDGYENVPANDEEALLKAVANQPVSVSIEASGKPFQFYSQGVFTGNCSTDLDHGVAVVGYGVDNNGTKYWIVKNSWGPSWGEQGYIRMQRSISAKEGLCGIAMDASYPIKTSPNPMIRKGKSYRRQLSGAGLHYS